MKLRCVSGYTNGPAGLVFRAGDEFNANEELARFLLADAPGCFKEVLVKKAGRPRKNKAILEPVIDK